MPRLVFCFAIGCWCLLQALASTAKAHTPAAEGATRGEVIISSPLILPALARSRTLRIYLPPGYQSSNRRYPVLYLHDGQNLFDEATSFAGEWGVDEALDQLAAEGQPLIAIGIDHGDERRVNELKPFDHPKHGAGEGKAYLQALIDTVIPYVNSHYRTLDGPEHTLIMGSSLGGLMSHYAALHHPRVFGAAGVFSPAYWIAEPLFRESSEQHFARHQRLYFLMGGAEGQNMVENFHRMQTIVERQTLATHFRLVPGGEHRETFWRAEFPGAIRWLLGTNNAQ